MTKESYLQIELIKIVYIDILCVIDSNHSLILIIRSFCGPLIDHSVLLFRLSDRFDLNGTALAWFKSYLKPRMFYVQVEGSKSTTRNLTCEVSQGSVLGARCRHH